MSALRYWLWTVAEAFCWVLLPILLLIAACPWLVPLYYWSWVIMRGQGSFF